MKRALIFWKFLCENSLVGAAALIHEVCSAWGSCFDTSFQFRPKTLRKGPPIKGEVKERVSSPASCFSSQVREDQKTNKPLSTVVRPSPIDILLNTGKSDKNVWCVHHTDNGALTPPPQRRVCYRSCIFTVSSFTRGWKRRSLWVCGKHFDICASSNQTGHITTNCSFIHSFIDYYSFMSNAQRTNQRLTENVPNSAIAWWTSRI